LVKPPLHKPVVERTSYSTSWGHKTQGWYSQKEEEMKEQKPLPVWEQEYNKTSFCGAEEREKKRDHINKSQQMVNGVVGKKRMNGGVESEESATDGDKSMK